MIELKVPGMSCAHCVSTVTAAVRRIDPAAQVGVDLAGKKVQVESVKDRAAIARALSEAGYPPAA